MVHELGHGLFGIGDVIERFDGRLVFFGAPFGDKDRVLLLDVGGINEHDAAQVAGGVGAMDRPGVALFDEIRQVAGVVNVRVAQDDGINRSWIERKIRVALGGFLAMPLEKATFEQQPFAIDLEQIHRAGGGARRAEEMDLHGANLTTDGHGWTRIFQKGKRKITFHVSRIGFNCAGR